MSTRLVGFTCSTFDMLHAGHILMLQEAKQQCDYLIVGLQTDPTIDRPDTKNSPVQSIVERQIQLSAVKYVDQIVVYQTESDLIEILKCLPIDVRIIGEEYLNKDFTGKQLCADMGIEIYYNRRRHDYSSSSLRIRLILNDVENQNQGTIMKINIDELNGEIIRDNETYIVEDNTYLKNLTVSKTTLYPGKQTGGHSHADLEEVYTFVKGTGIIIIDDTEQACAPGDIFMIPDGSFHRVRNTGDTNLEFICIFQKYTREDKKS